MLITIKTYRDVIDANLDKDYLEAHDIRCYLMNENMVAADWLASQATGGVELQVNDEDTEKANQLLSK